MTRFIAGTEFAPRIAELFPGAVVGVDHEAVTVKADSIVDVALFLRDDDDFDCKYLNSLTAVDWLEHFDVVYHLSSLAKNHTLCVKARAGHENVTVPSLGQVWQGADLQEREVYDLMGISFSGHPRMKRMFLWDGFPGHPLRKDFLQLPGNFKPGLQRFPFEFPTGEREYPYLGRVPADNPEALGPADIEVDAPVDAPPPGAPVDGLPQGAPQNEDPRL